MQFPSSVRMIGFEYTVVDNYAQDSERGYRTRWLDYQKDVYACNYIINDAYTQFGGGRIEIHIDALLDAHGTDIESIDGVLRGLLQKHGYVLAQN